MKMKRSHYIFFLLHVMCRSLLGYDWDWLDVFRLDSRHILQNTTEEDIFNNYPGLFSDRLEAHLYLSGWAALVILTLKDDFSNIRICGVFRTTINGVLDTGIYVIPIVEDLSTSLVEGQTFRKFI